MVFLLIQMPLRNVWIKIGLAAAVFVWESVYFRSYYIIIAALTVVCFIVLRYLHYRSRRPTVLTAVLTMVALMAAIGIDCKKHYCFRACKHGNFRCVRDKRKFCCVCCQLFYQCFSYDAAAGADTKGCFLSAVCDISDVHPVLSDSFISESEGTFAGASAGAERIYGLYSGLVLI